MTSILYPGNTEVHSRGEELNYQHVSHINFISNNDENYYYANICPEVAKIKYQLLQI